MNINVKCKRGFPLSGYAEQPYYEELVLRISTAVAIGLVRDATQCTIVIENNREYEDEYDYAVIPGSNLFVAYLDEGVMLCPVFRSEPDLGSDSPIVCNI